MSQKTNIATDRTTLDRVCLILSDALQLGPGSAEFDANTRLFGVMPEFDSMTVVTVLTLIEEEFSITIHDVDVSADIFSTAGSLSEFVEAKVSA